MADLMVSPAACWCVTSEHYFFRNVSHVSFAHYLQGCSWMNLQCWLARFTSQ